MVEELIGLGALGALAAGFAVVALVVMLASYIYFALVLMTLARKLNTEPAWLAWIPIANVYLLWKISRTPTWSIIVFAVGMLLAGIPILGQVLALAALGVMIYWFWMIAEQRKYPGWVSLLMIIPLGNIIVPGVLAWVDRK